MPAKIITLATTRRSNVRCPETGIVFPQVYRRLGVFWKPREGIEIPNGGLIRSHDDLEPGEDPAISYALDMQNDQGVANSTWQAVTCLDAKVDRGWVIIRHHLNSDFLAGYLDGVEDTNPYQEESSRLGVYDTNLGLFTVLHRPATIGTADRLLVYQTKVYEPLFGGLMDWSRVISREGVELDVDALLPEEVREETAEMLSRINNPDPG